MKLDPNGNTNRRSFLISSAAAAGLAVGRSTPVYTFQNWRGAVMPSMPMAFRFWLNS